MSHQNINQFLPSPTMFASPEELSDYEDEYIPMAGISTEEYRWLPSEGFTQSPSPCPVTNAARISRAIASFYEALAALDAHATANTLQGEASKVESYSAFAEPISPDASSRFRTRGFGGGRVVRHTVFSEEPRARERRLIKESTFRLQPAPLWTRVSTRNANRVVPFKEIKVGASCGNSVGDASDTLLTPQPTAKVSSWLYGIPGTSSEYENLFEAEEPLELHPYYRRAASPLCLADLDSFNPVFEIKGFEATLPFEVIDPRTRAFITVIHLESVLLSLSKHVKSQ